MGTEIHRMKVTLDALGMEFLQVSTGKRDGDENPRFGDQRLGKHRVRTHPKQRAV